MSRLAESAHSAGRGSPSRARRSAKLHDHTVQEHEQAVQELRRQLELYRRYVFGPRRERLVEAPGQGHLFELDAGESVPMPPEPPARNQGKPARSRRSRKPDYDRLTQVRIEHDVPEAEKLRTHCGEAKARFGEDEARVLEFIPTRVELHIHVLPKYACSLRDVILQLSVDASREYLEGLLETPHGSPPDYHATRRGGCLA
jgi:hypothetical protein